jgi:hypothetical protein
MSFTDRNTFSSLAREYGKSVTMADSFAGKFDLYFMLTIDLLLGIYFY